MRGRRRFRTTAAAVALLCAATLAGGCSAGQGPKSAGTRPAAEQTAQPAPSSTPTPPPAPVWNASPGSVAAVGDSITRAFDACELLADCPSVSWATGTDPAVNSLALRLLGPERLPARSWNLARSGARMADLPEQMAAAAARRPELVTVMMGANDACRADAARMTPVEEFRASFATALARLRAGAPKAQVYVSSVPDLKRLWATGRLSPAGLRVWRLGVCASMLADAENLGPAAEARRTKVRDRVVAYNRVLREECAKDVRCRYDGGAVFGFAFDGTQLSPWDWFHPSRDGQARLAEIAYRQITRK
ncbi:SGNH/GDSL hydrolase family protein [Streptomyces sp. NPDC126499]|uniref:SGNH/GDSL hydrolase family protein n=1 Tax=Streptomyces sp. NPDC126499 TaxID=3155314 RepID=UPI00332A8699